MKEINLNHYLKTIKHAQDLAPINHERFLTSKQAWLQDVRVMLVEQQMAIPAPAVFAKSSFHFLTWVRPVASVAAVFLFIMTGGGMAVYGSLQSMPGDSLYSFKLSVERLRLDLARSPAKKNAVLVSLANERLHEADSILATNKRPEVQAAVQQFKDKVQKAKETAQGNDGQQAETLAQVQQLVGEKTLVIALQAKPQPQTDQPVGTKAGESVVPEDRLTAAKKAAEANQLKAKNVLVSAPPVLRPLSTIEDKDTFAVHANLLYTPYQAKP